MAGPSVLLNHEFKVLQVIQGGGQYMRMQDGQFDGGLSSFFFSQPGCLSQSSASGFQKDIRTVSLEKAGYRLGRLPRGSFVCEVRFFNLTEGEYYLIQIKSEEKTESEAADSPMDLRELKDSRIQILENALNESNWNLKLAVEESESRNEELQAHQ